MFRPSWIVCVFCQMLISKTLTGAKRPGAEKVNENNEQSARNQTGFFDFPKIKIQFVVKNTENVWSILHVNIKWSFIAPLEFLLLLNFPKIAQLPGNPHTGCEVKIFSSKFFQHSVLQRTIEKNTFVLVTFLCKDIFHSDFSQSGEVHGFLFGSSSMVLYRFQKS